MDPSRVFLKALLLVPVVVLAAEEAATTRAYPLPGHGVLNLSVPPSWRDAIGQPPGDRSPTIEFSPPSGSDFSVQITPLWSPRADPEFNLPGTIRPLVETIGRQQLPQAVETDITLKEVKGPRVAGYYFTVTDRAPKQGEWTYLTAGAAGTGDLLLSFTILTNTLDSLPLRQALAMIQEARQEAPKSQPAPAPAATTTPSPRRR